MDDSLEVHQSADSSDGKLERNGVSSLYYDISIQNALLAKVMAYDQNVIDPGHPVGYKKYLLPVVS